MEENISVKEAFRDLESLLFARKELWKKNGARFGALDALIADKAALLVHVFNKAINEKSKEKPAEKKSEMPCNCNCAEKPKTLQEIINDVKAQLTDNQTYAVIVFRVDDTDTR